MFLISIDTFDMRSDREMLHLCHLNILLQRQVDYKMFESNTSCYYEIQGQIREKMTEIYQSEKGYKAVSKGF